MKSEHVLPLCRHFFVSPCSFQAPFQVAYPWLKGSSPGKRQLSTIPQSMAFVVVLKKGSAPEQRLLGRSVPTPTVSAYPEVLKPEQQLPDPAVGGPVPTETPSA